ncbi:MAG TPA: CHASE domain-containing protein, partial [Ideonella sp.]|nr:CHASE domain-containing protein [Ideonella sp.]
MPVPPLATRYAPALLTALAYVLTGQMALWLAAHPGYAAPLYPAAGVALASVLVYGRAALPGVALGSLIVAAVLSDPHGLQPGAALAGAVLIAAGATAQAAAGAWLMRRKLSGPGSLAEPRDALGLCLWGAAVACLVNATVAGFSLWAVNGVPATGALYAALTWWSGDALGVLIGTPIVLTVIGRPRELWVPRRLTVALPLLVVTTVLTLAMLTVAGGDWRRGLGVFERDASQAADALESGLRAPVYALEATRSLFIGSEQVTQAEMQAASEVWLRPPSDLLAVGFSRRVAKAQLAPFEAEAQADGMPGYRVFERADAAPGLTAGDDDVVAIRHILPLEPNRRALGVNTLSIPAARAAIGRATLGDAPAASAGFVLTQESGGDETGVVIYRAVYESTATPEPARRRAALRGVAFVTLRMGPVVRGLLAHMPAYLQWCLVDTDPAAPRR